MGAQNCDLRNHKSEMLLCCSLTHSVPPTTEAWRKDENAILNSDQLTVKENSFCSDKRLHNLNIQKIGFSLQSRQVNKDWVLVSKYKVFEITYFQKNKSGTRMLRCKDASERRSFLGHFALGKQFVERPL